MPPVRQPQAAIGAAAMAQPAAAPAHADVPIERTSLAGRNAAPDEVTVRFLKWSTHGNTAYQKGQFAGFKIDVARKLVQSGIAIIAETPQQKRDAADRFMVTK